MTKDSIAIWLRSTWWQIVLGLIGLGAMWATQVSALSNKADKSTVEDMARDIKTIRAVVCADHRQDSYCR